MVVKILWIFISTWRNGNMQYDLHLFFKYPKVERGKTEGVVVKGSPARHLHQDFDNILSSLMTFFKLAVGETHFFQGMLGKFFAQNIPICSMYGIFTYIWLRIMVIPGAFGIVSNHTREMLLFLTNNQFLTDEYFAPLLGGGYMFHPYLGKWSILTSILQNDESSKVVVHFPCHGCLQIIVWMCVFLLF